MIRLVQRHLIIPRGDTGSFSVPLLRSFQMGDVAVFAIFDILTRTIMFKKVIELEGDILHITLTHDDTVNLKPGKYLWDIKSYCDPQYADGELVNGREIDSYYAGYTLPVCEIRETADEYLMSPDAPDARLTPDQLDIITRALHDLNEAIRMTNENVAHYPIIINETWYVWDAQTNEYISTGVSANGIVGPQGIPGSEYTVMIQNDQPQEETNKIWIPLNLGTTTQVPTYEEFTGFAREVHEWGLSVVDGKLCITYNEEEEEGEDDGNGD